jgi:hypothetical protein
VQAEGRAKGSLATAPQACGPCARSGDVCNAALALSDGDYSTPIGAQFSCELALKTHKTGILCQYINFNWNK